MTFYFDSSALVKLVLEEQESAAIQGWMKSIGGGSVSSHLALTEVMRTVRVREPLRERRAVEVMELFSLIALPKEVFERAAIVAPAHLRSLDTLHLACALSLGSELSGLITYDDRMAQAAFLNRIKVIAPS